MINGINSIEDVRLFAYQLAHEENLSFHPDSDFSEYISLETGDSLYTQEEVHVLNQLMERCFDTCQKYNTDIYVIMGQPIFEKMKMGEYAGTN